jgi:hypothetical protein
MVLSVTPCPATGPVTIVATLPAGVEGRVSLFDARGILARELCADVPGGCSTSLTWDGRDCDGLQSSQGIYFVRLEAGGSTVTGRVVLLR